MIILNLECYVWALRSQDSWSFDHYFLLRTLFFHCHPHWESRGFSSEFSLHIWSQIRSIRGITSQSRVYPRSARNPAFLSENLWLKQGIIKTQWQKICMMIVLSYEIPSSLEKNPLFPRRDGKWSMFVLFIPRYCDQIKSRRNIVASLC